MNILTQNQSMTSVEIADLVETEHRNVKLSIERLIKRGVIRDTPMTNIEKINNLGLPSKVGLYVFSGEQGKRDSIIVVAQLCPEFTARLVDRWQELENKQPRIPQTYAESLRALADTHEQLALQAPKVELYEKLIHSDELMNATQVAQKFGISAIKLNEMLFDHGVYTLNMKRSRGKAFKQWFIKSGYGEMKHTRGEITQPLFTVKGEEWISNNLF